MSSIITNMLSSTVGLLCNKARDKTAAQLKDGDITDAKIREIVVRDLDDIKTKLDGLSRTNLLSSYRFLKEGVDLLNVSLDNAKPKPKGEKAVLDEAQDGRGLRMQSGVESCTLVTEALVDISHAMENLKIHSAKEVETAKERFKYARVRATDAFCNEALSIKDRILAAKLRVISEILECLETPQTAITGCLSFLKELHGLPAIREMFSVYLNGGLKSLLNKVERVENVKSVMLINYVLFKFVFKVSRKFTDRVNWPSTWPVIELTDRSFHPILNWQELSTKKSWGDELTQSPQGLLILLKEINPYLSAVNSHGEIVVGDRYDIKVISKTGESKVVKLPDLRSNIVGLAVDNNNNVYVVTSLRTCAENGFVLHVLDDNYNVKHDCTLDFLDSIFSFGTKLAVNKNNNIIMIKYGDPHVYVCDNTGQLKHKFELRDSIDGSLVLRLNISDKNEIMIPSGDRKTVHIYTEEGDMKSSIKVPEGHEVRSVVFHHVISKIIVLSWFEEQHSFFLLCYSETGELETSALFGKYELAMRCPNITCTSYPGGPVAVVESRRITFI